MTINPYDVVVIGAGQIGGLTSRVLREVPPQCLEALRAGARSRRSESVLTDFYEMRQGFIPPNK
jgi:hypothetical protein